MHAKHIYHSILIIAAAGATACSSESNAPEPAVEAQELSFQANTDTRASVVTTMNTPFEVYGEFATTGDPAASHTQLFNATPVSLSGGKWTYGTPEYWMPGNTYSFIALHPAPKDGAGVTGLTNKEYDKDSQQLSFTYTLPDNYTDATDLLAATHRRQYNLGPTPTTPVSLNFTHLLARLNFTVHISSVGTQNQTTSVMINSLTLRKVSNSATFTASSAPITTGTETDDYGVKEWTNHSEPTATLFTITPNIRVSAGNSYSFFPSNNALMAIPQLLTSDLEIEIEYTPYINGTKQTLSKLKGNLYTVALESHGARWATGQSYTYSFTLGGEEYIIFNKPTVEQWNQEEGANYIIND